MESRGKRVIRMPQRYNPETFVIDPDDDIDDDDEDDMDIKYVPIGTKPQPNLHGFVVRDAADISEEEEDEESVEEEEEAEFTDEEEEEKEDDDDDDEEEEKNEKDESPVKD